MFKHCGCTYSERVAFISRHLKDLERCAYHAARQGHMAAMNRILDTGFQEHFRETSLVQYPVIFRGDCRMMKLLLERGFFCCRSLSWWEGVVLRAIETANAPMLQLVHEHCPRELPMQNSERWCMVTSAAVSRNDPAIVNVLLDHGWDAGLLLSNAVFYAQQEMAQDILDHPKVQRKRVGGQELLRAVRLGSVERVQFLIHNGAKAAFEGEDMRAAVEQKGNKEIIKLFEANGASDDDGAI
jgi:hypothetical protein